MVWPYWSSIPVGRRGYLTRSNYFCLPAFAALRGAGGGQHPVITQSHIYWKLLRLTVPFSKNQMMIFYYDKMTAITHQFNTIKNFLAEFLLMFTALSGWGFKFNEILKSWTKVRRKWFKKKKKISKSRDTGSFCIPIAIFLKGFMKYKIHAYLGYW